MRWVNVGSTPRTSPSSARNDHRTILREVTSVNHEEASYLLSAFSISQKSLRMWIDVVPCTVSQRTTATAPLCSRQAHACTTTRLPSSQAEYGTLSPRIPRNEYRARAETIKKKPAIDNPGYQYAPRKSSSDAVNNAAAAPGPGSQSGPQRSATNAIELPLRLPALCFWEVSFVIGHPGTLTFPQQARTLSRTALDNV